jgi:hypothetical protein
MVERDQAFRVGGRINRAWPLARRLAPVGHELEPNGGTMRPKLNTGKEAAVIRLRHPIPASLAAAVRLQAGSHGTFVASLRVRLCPPAAGSRRSG